MGSASTPGIMHVVTVKPCMPCSRRIYMSSTENLGTGSKVKTWKKHSSSSQFSSRQPLFHSFSSGPVKLNKAVIKAVSGAAENNPVSNLPIDLRGRKIYHICLATSLLLIYWIISIAVLVITLQLV